MLQGPGYRFAQGQHLTQWEGVEFGREGDAGMEFERWAGAGEIKEEKNISPGKQHSEGLESTMISEVERGAWEEQGVSCGWWISGAPRIERSMLLGLLCCRKRFGFCPGS